MEKLQKKIKEASRRMEDLSDKIMILTAEKKKAVDAANEASVKGDIDSAMECKKLQDELEVDIKALNEIMAVLGREKPFDADVFFEEFNKFQEQQKTTLSEIYEKLVKGLIELHKLYSDYEVVYGWYESQHRTWQDTGNKISLGQLPKVVSNVAGGLHGKIKNSLSTLIR